MRDGVVEFRAVASPSDLARLEAALRALSADIREDFTAQSSALERAVLADQPAAHGLLALQAGRTLGAAFYSSAFSTVRGAAGVHLSDLWISTEARGQGLGARLLAQVAARGEAQWGATWLKLGVYDHSDAAQNFYKRLGFELVTGTQELRLDASAMADLIKRTA